MATSVKHPLENDIINNFPLVILFLPFRINWLVHEMFVSLTTITKLIILFLIKIFHLLTLAFKPAPWVSHKKSSEKTYSMVNVSWNLSQYVIGNSKSFFFCWKYMKYMVEYMIRKDHAIISSKLSYKGKVRLKELQKILRSFRFHFMKFAWKLPKQTQQLTTEYCWSSVLNLKL